jgi:hypothetical protein
MTLRGPWLTYFSRLWGWPDSGHFSLMEMQHLTSQCSVRLVWMAGLRNRKPGRPVPQEELGTPADFSQSMRWLENLLLNWYAQTTLPNESNCTKYLIDSLLSLDYTKLNSHLISDFLWLLRNVIPFHKSSKILRIITTVSSGKVSTVGKPESQMQREIYSGKCLIIRPFCQDSVILSAVLTAVWIATDWHGIQCVWAVTESCQCLANITLTTSLYALCCMTLVQCFQHFCSQTVWNNNSLAFYHMHCIIWYNMVVSQLSSCYDLDDINASLH